MRPELQILLWVGVFALCSAQAMLIRRLLRNLAAANPPAGTWRGALATRYGQWDEGFVRFLVWWTGAALFFAVGGVLVFATGHWWWGGFCLFSFLFALTAIAAAIRYGKATFRNIGRVLVPGRLRRSDR